MEPKRKAVLQMRLCATMWSTGGIFIKLIPWNSFVIAGWRSLISAGTVKNDVSELSNVQNIKIEYKTGSGSGGSLTENYDSSNPLMKKTFTFHSSGNGEAPLKEQFS